VRQPVVVAILVKAKSPSWPGRLHEVGTGKCFIASQEETISNFTTKFFKRYIYT
jgi:hypothetical protein